MNDAVDRVMASYEKLPVIEGLGLEEIRTKVGQYLAKLSSAGHSETEELIFYGLAYLRSDVAVVRPGQQIAFPNGQAPPDLQPPPVADGLRRYP
jgi:hypothetical protein